MAGNDLPSDQSLGGFRAEVERHYATTSDVNDKLEPLKEKIDNHLGYHDGFRFTMAMVIPFACVLITATAIIVATAIG